LKKEKFKEGMKIPYQTITTTYDREERKHIELDIPHLKYLGYGHSTMEWEDNYIFETTLKFINFSKGRSSVKAHFVSIDTGCEFEMFLSDFEELVKANRSFSKLKGYFCFRKQGANYGVVLLEDYK